MSDPSAPVAEVPTAELPAEEAPTDEVPATAAADGSGPEVPVAPAAPASGARVPDRVRTVLVVALVAAVALAAVGLVGWRRAADRADDLAAQVRTLETRTDELETDLEDARRSAAIVTAVADLLRGLAGGDGLNGLLEGDGLRRLGDQLDEFLRDRGLDPGGLLQGTPLEGLLGGAGV